MDKKQTIEALQALAKGSNRSEAAMLRDIFDNIDAAIHAGVSRAAIFATLQQQGFTISFKTFESTLYRIRKQRKKMVAQIDSSNTLPINVKEEIASKQDNIVHTQQNEASADLLELTPKQRREKIADKFIKPDNLNPRLKKLLEKK